MAEDVVNVDPNYEWFSILRDVQASLLEQSLLHFHTRVPISFQHLCHRRATEKQIHVEVIALLQRQNSSSDIRAERVGRAVHG